jgi:hypothetical protein
MLWSHTVSLCLATARLGESGISRPGIVMCATRLALPCDPVDDASKGVSLRIILTATQQVNGYTSLG